MIGITARTRKRCTRFRIVSSRQCAGHPHLPRSTSWAISSPLAAQNPNYVDPREEPQHGYTFTDSDVDAVLGGNAARILGLTE